MQIAGASEPLELSIDGKQYLTADGTVVEVLRDFALRLSGGAFVSLIGPSGCGKTTILRIAAGLDRDFRGERRLAPRIRVAMVFQEPRLLAWRTVEENIRLAMNAAAVTTAIDELLEKFELLEQRHRYAGELSLGQARRVAVARAISIQPDLLLLDEPFVSLDRAIADRLRLELQAIAKARRMSVLMVTHDLEEAIRLSDRLLFLGGVPTRVTLEKEVAVSPDQQDPATIEALAREWRSLAAAADGSGIPCPS